jgi:hypothetical protein
MNPFTWLQLFSGVSIGAMIGGLCTVAAVIVQATLARRNDRLREQAAVDAFLSTIHDELDAMWARYIEGPGGHLESLRSGEPFMVFMPVYQDYFTFYGGNSHLMSQISDRNVRNLVVRAYAAAKGFIDSFRGNNELLQRYRFADTMFRHTGNVAFEAESTALWENMANYANDLKARHDELALLSKRVTVAIEFALRRRRRRQTDKPALRQEDRKAPVAR